METTSNLIESPFVIGPLVLLGLFIVLKLLGLAMKVIGWIMLLAVAVFVYFVFFNGAP